jgi:hypothetical protein
VASVRAQMTAGRRKFPVVPSAEIMRDVAILQEAVARRVIDRLKEYPPELENQRYIRTFRLQNSWRASRSRFLASAGVALSINNFATDRSGKRYASLVQGKDQRPIHEGRWLRIDEAMRDERNLYRAGVKAIMVAHGLT